MGVRHYAAAGAVVILASGVVGVVALAGPAGAPSVAGRPTTSATPKPSATHRQVAPPILILVEPAVNRRWHITHAVNVWNAATGCQLLTTRDDGPHTDLIIIREHHGMTYAPGKPLRGLYTAGTVPTIELNPDTPHITNLAAIHELGHALGLTHDHDPHGVMNIDRDGDALVADGEAGPDGAEVGRVRHLQAARCAQ